MKRLLELSWLPGDNSEIAVQRYPFVIGRQTSSDCSLSLPVVSRRHCQLVRIGEEVLVQDLKSRNGTFVNGKRVSCSLPVQDGDELMLGHCSFRLSMLHDTGEMPAQGPGSTETEVPEDRPSHAGDKSSVNCEVCSLPQAKPSTGR
jgi:predicted component of type VI protein secretion system